MLKLAAGFTMAVLSAVCYGVSAVLTKMVGDQGVSVSSVLLVRGILGWLLLAGISRVSGSNARKLGNEMKRKAVVLSVFGSGATLLMLNQAYRYLPVGSVTTIHYLFPAIVNVVGARMSKTRLSTSTKAVLFLCMAGTLLLFDSLEGSQLPGVAFAVISIATWSFQILYLEYSGLTACPALAVGVWQCAVVAVMGLLCGLGERHTLGLAVHALPLLIMAALLNNVLANILFQEGIKRIGGGLTAILSIFEPISSIILGYVMLGEAMGIRQTGAVLLILAAIGILIIRKGREERNTA